MNRNKSLQSGVALLMTLGILALLSILGVAYSTNMRLMETTTRDFVHEMQARYLAEGGIEYAIAELKEDARNNFVFDGVSDNDELTRSNIEFPQDVVGDIRIKVIDTARQININTANPTLLACLPGIETLGGDIVSKRDEIPNNRFLTKQSISLTDNVGEGTFDDIKDYITADTYIDKKVRDDQGNLEERSAININTYINWAKQGDTKANDILKKILMVVSGVGDDRAGNIVALLKSPPAPDTLPIESWTEFIRIVDQAEGIGNVLRKRINEMFNPNRKKPSATYATDFCFHSGGTYEITATGTLTKNNQTLAKKTVTGTIKIFDLLNHTTMEQWQGDIDKNWNGAMDSGEDTNGDSVWNEPRYANVTWLDSCPVNLDESYPTTGYSTVSAETIEDSIKLGFWEDFNFWDGSGGLIQDRWDYSKAQWYNQSGRFFAKSSGALGKTIRAVWDTPTAGLEFYGKRGNTLSYPILCLGRTDRNEYKGESSVPQYIRDRWRLDEFSLRLYLASYTGQYKTGGESIIDKEYAFGYPKVEYRRDRIENRYRKYDTGAHIFLKRRSEWVWDQAQRDVFVNHIDPWRWDREGTNPYGNGIRAGKWGGIRELWKATVSSDLGQLPIHMETLGHEGVLRRPTPPRGWTMNEDINKNPWNYPDSWPHPNDDNDNRFDTTSEGDSDTIDNIDEGWKEIYYDDRAFPRNSYLCIQEIPWKTVGGRYVENEEDVGILEHHYQGGNYRILYKKIGRRDQVRAKADLYNYDPDDNTVITENEEPDEKTVEYGGALDDGHFALYSANYLFFTRDIRIINKTGFYSYQLQLPDLEEIPEWGTIWGTETIPDSARENSEKIALQISVDNTNWYPNVNQFSEIDSQLRLEGESIFYTLQNNGISPMGDSINFRANFTTSDTDYIETPVLEDVWITYLPKTKVLYWREGIAEED